MRSDRDPGRLRDHREGVTRPDRPTAEPVGVERRRASSACGRPDGGSRRRRCRTRSRRGSGRPRSSRRAETPPVPRSAASLAALPAGGGPDSALEPRCLGARGLAEVVARAPERIDHRARRIRKRARRTALERARQIARRQRPARRARAAAGRSAASAAARRRSPAGGLHRRRRRPATARPRRSDRRPTRRPAGRRAATRAARSTARRPGCRRRRSRS